MRKPQSLAVLLTFLLPVAIPAMGDYTPWQYAKALWLATRFYGGQRSGEGPNWITQDSPKPTSFVKDKYLTEGDIAGGWFDCGDHVMFGQTQFYSAYLLAKSYDLFSSGFRDYYHGDYSDYKASQDYSIDGGTPNGIPDLLEELRYEADFLVKITPDSNTFISQKGNGDYDHYYWVYAGYMTGLDVIAGGERNGYRPVVVNPADGSMPGQAAAALAVMARADTDTARQSQYLKHARYAYSYARKYTTTVGAGSYYSANRKAADAKLNAAYELFATTGDSTYLQEAQEFAVSLTLNGYHRLDYENDEPLAGVNAYLLMGIAQNTTNPALSVDKWLSVARSNVSSLQNGVTLQSYDATKFPLRGPLGYAAIQAMVNRITNDTTYDSFIFDQVDYALGSNTGNQSYLIGFDENGKKQPTKPHHRNIYLNTAIGWGPEDMGTIPARNKYFGALVGGKLDGTYSADITNLSMNEPCLDLNAPLVAALGYIVSKVAPNTQPLPVKKPQNSRAAFRLPAKVEGETLVLQLPAQGDLQILTLDGTAAFRGTLQAGTFRWEAPMRGVYFIHFIGPSGAAIAYPIHIGRI